MPLRRRPFLRVRVTVTKPVSINGQAVISENVLSNQEVRLKEAQTSGIDSRNSIRASQTTNDLVLKRNRITRRASLPLPIDETLFLN
jgi:hypothetical protein